MTWQVTLVTDPSIHLEGSDIHIWWVSLDLPPQTLSEQFSLLSADEQARAGRYHFERDRLHYIAGRAFLRLRLGAYLGVMPADIEFDYNPLGKPALKTTFADRTLQFNFSNSTDRALAVFRWGQPIGVDLEWVHPMQDEKDFARQFFCVSEIALLDSLKGEAKRRMFYKIWTCKEALLKAMGDGLTRPINQVELAFKSSTAQLVAIGGDTASAHSWMLELFEPAPGFQAALAATVSEQSRILCMKFFRTAP